MPDTIIYVIMIYHIRYISTYLPAAWLVLGTISAPFGVWEILRAPFHIWHGSIWHDSAFSDVQAQLGSARPDQGLTKSKPEP